LQITNIEKQMDTPAPTTRAVPFFGARKMAQELLSEIEGLTRRLDPMDRIRELSDASVPFNFDVHALFFSNDAVGIELAMHERLADLRVNTVNRRREFFLVTPLEVKAQLSELTGELLEFNETAEALEYRQTLRGVAPSKIGRSTAA
jgi:hypothetical protein